MDMSRVKAQTRASFFCAALDSEAAVLELAGCIVADASQPVDGAALLVSTSPLARHVADMTPEELVAFLPRNRLIPAAAAAACLAVLGTEVKKRDYLLEELADELACAPACVPDAAAPLGELIGLSRRGFRVAGLPEDVERARQALLRVGAQHGVSLEYLLGNAAKLALLLRRFGVRDETINASGLFHNFMSGFLELEVDSGAAGSSVDLLRRAAALDAQGSLIKVFRKGDFNKLLSGLSVEEFDALAAETSGNYATSDATFRGFVEALIAREEARLNAAPELELVTLLQAFKFAEGERDLVARPAAAKHDDPANWELSEIGGALKALRSGLDWIEVSAGSKAAGDAKTAMAGRDVRAALAGLRAAGSGYAVIAHSGRGGARAERRIDALSDEDLLFDLYCLAVLARRPLREVIDTACGIVRLATALENPEPVIDLNHLVNARFSGEPLSNVLTANGLVLRNSSLGEAQAMLKSVGDKLELTIDAGEAAAVSLATATHEQFRRAVVRMGRAMRSPDAPDRVLALIRGKIVPEIRRLPGAVIAPGAHELSRLVALAAAGVPARYPLRRAWLRVNIDPLTTLGSGLAPGIRNCLGCPVNSLYGLVTKTALATGFEEIVTYEATGCFEVYSGIWPYTGKQHPSLHGVFGGAPSELLGGLAAKKARMKFARRQSNGGGAPAAKRTLHLGWGGDGGTFDIGFGNLSGLFSRLQKLTQDDLDQALGQRALYVCYDNEGYQNTGNQYSAASAPGGSTTTNPQGQEKPMGNELKKKHMVEIMAEHGASVSARMNIHRPEHITRVIARALEDGIEGSFLHFLQPCTTGWKFTADSLTYDLAYLCEEGGLFPPVTYEHGVPYLEVYPTQRDPGDMFLRLQARFKHLLGSGASDRKNAQRVMQYYGDEWRRNVALGGYDGEIAHADRLGYLEEEHRKPRINV